MEKANEDPRSQRPAGRVLGVKVGYNPNSSSIGSAIPVFLAAAVGSGAVTAFLLNLLGTAGAILRQRKEEQAGERGAASGERGAGSGERGTNQQREDG